jgi:hypothetical protein
MIYCRLTLPIVDSLEFSGRRALTRTVKEYAESVEPRIPWQSLSSHVDSAPGGRARFAFDDVLVGD